MTQRILPGWTSRVRLPATLLAALPLLWLPARAGPGGELPPEVVDALVAEFCAAAPAAPVPRDPLAIPLSPTAHANGAAGSARLRFAASPFGLTVTADGHHVYDLRLEAGGLPPAPAHVAWAVTPTLGSYTRLGALDAEGRVMGRVQFNKFLVFVTAEPSAEVERWSGPILLRGISRSGKLHTMRGHGPFETESC